MSSKLTRTILLAGTVGFLIVWVLEFRRTTLFDSYWLLLLSITCLLFFQFNRLKSSMAAKKNAEEEVLAKTSKKATTSKESKK
jgi:hypothetical protein